MTPEDRKKVPEMHQMWIDIGAKDNKEAQKMINIGDSVVIDFTFKFLNNKLFVGRGLDNKLGTAVLIELLKYFDKNHPHHFLESQFYNLLKKDFKKVDRKYSCKIIEDHKDFYKLKRILYDKEYLRVIRINAKKSYSDLFDFKKT